CGLLVGPAAAAEPPGGKICSQDGFCWEHPLPQGNNLHALWGTGPDRLYAAGDHGTVLRWDGARWSGQCGLGGGAALRALTGFGELPYAAGDNGTVLRFDGKAWKRMDTGTREDLRALSGTRPDHLFAAGEHGVILHYDGKA